MADFDVNTITVQGAVAIASATAGDKLVIDGCDATTDVLTQAQAVQIATRPASPASTTDTIGLAGSTDNHVYAYASFIRGESTGGDVHSFLLYGHMESDATNVFVVAVASATAPTHIPTSSDVTNRVEIQFELTFSATDEVVTVTDTSMYTTRGEFLILKNRTVTTHAEGQATVGEDQTVYGKKEFMDDMIFNGMYQVQAKTLDGQNTQNMFAFTQNGERQNVGPTITALTTYNGTSYVSSNASIGATATLDLAGGASFSAEHKAVGDSNATMMATRGLGGAYAGVVVEPTQVTLYTQAASGGARKTVVFNGSALEVGANVYAPSMVAEKFELLNASASMEWDAQSSTIYFSQPITVSSFKQEDGNVKIDDAGVYTDNLNPMSGSKIEANGSIVPGTSNTYNLGSGNPSRRWKEAYISVAHTGEVRYDNEVSVTAYNGNTGADDYARLILDGSAADDPFVEFQLESNAYGQSASYIFSLGYFAAPGIDLGYANGGGWNNIYANSSIHSPLITGDQEELTLYAQGTGNGKSEIGMSCTNSSVSVSINLQANQESNVVYAFTRYSLSGPGKDLGYQNGGEWNNIYAKNLHGKLPAPKPNAPNDPPIGTIFLACIERDASSSSYVLNAGANLRPGYDPTCIGIYYATITSWSNVTGGHSIAFCKGTALPTYNGTTGVYRTLSMADFNTYLLAYVLVMRVA